MLLASFGFYASYDPRMPVVVLLDAILAYAAGLFLAPTVNLRFRSPLLVLSLVLNFAPLAAFKYWNLPFGFVPLGISFYILQAASYMIDVYNGKYSAEVNPARFVLFMTFFPQAIQGPINRWDNLGPQLFDGSKFDAENIRFGLQLMIWGLLKKVLVADTLRVFVDRVFVDYHSLGGAVIFTAVALYCIQLYADFSGGIDVARGAAEMFGIIMAENFRQPYLATSIDDFWRRWHMSLSSWMRDYIFYPLALWRPFGRLGRRCRRAFGHEIGKAVPVALATVITFLAVGVWQGPGWSNVAYGLWNGGLMALSLLARPFTGKASYTGKRGGPARCSGVLRTLLLVCIGRYFSRAETLSKALHMLKKTVTVRAIYQFTDGTLGNLGLTFTAVALAAPVCLMWLWVSFMRERGVSPRAYLAEKPASLQFALLFAGVSLLVVIAYIDPRYVASKFIYEGLNR